MYPMERYLRSVQIWQDACVAYGKLMIEASAVVGYQMSGIARGALNADEAARLVLEKTATFAQALERSRADASGQVKTGALADHAARPGLPRSN